MNAVTTLGLPNFRGVFMRDELSKIKPRKNEMGIMNLDTSISAGTHWTAYSKTGNHVVFFDSFGLRPPLEILRYFKGSRIEFSNDKQQSYGMYNCGHLCLRFLIKEAGFM